VGGFADLFRNLLHVCFGWRGPGRSPRPPRPPPGDDLRPNHQHQFSTKGCSTPGAWNVQIRPTWKPRSTCSRLGRKTGSGPTPVATCGQEQTARCVAPPAPPSAASTQVAPCPRFAKGSGQVIANPCGAFAAAEGVLSRLRQETADHYSQPASDSPAAPCGSAMKQRWPARGAHLRISVYLSACKAHDKHAPRRHATSTPTWQGETIFQPSSATDRTVTPVDAAEPNGDRAASQRWAPVSRLSGKSGAALGKSVARAIT